MKRLLSFTIIIAVHLCANAQFKSFFGNESWEYHLDYLMTCYTDDYNPNVFNTCCATFSVKFQKNDTLRIGEYLYYSYRPPYHIPNLDPGPVFIREDTAFGRLYGRYDTIETNDEYLLCDMSLSVGDTFVLPDGSANWSPYGVKIMIVDSVKDISGLRVLYLSIINDTYEFFYDSESLSYFSEYNISLRFMEGVGPMYGIHPPVSEPLMGVLLCLFKDDTLNYLTNETLGCEQFGSNISEYPQFQVQFIPNPVSGLMTIELTTENEFKGILLIRDLTGRVCGKYTIADQITTIDLSALPKGMYIATFTDQKTVFGSHKIIKQ